MSRERPGHTLQTTALVNEAYLRLVDQENMRWENRAHLLGLATQAMRRLAVGVAVAHIVIATLNLLIHNERIL
jgi:hypothetical protein